METHPYIYLCNIFSLRFSRGFIALSLSVSLSFKIHNISFLLFGFLFHFSTNETRMNADLVPLKKSLYRPF